MNPIFTPRPMLLKHCLNVNGMAQLERRVLGEMAESQSLYQTGKGLMDHVHSICIFPILKISFINVNYTQDYDDSKYSSCQTSEKKIVNVPWCLKNIDL